MLIPLQRDNGSVLLNRMGSKVKLWKNYRMNQQQESGRRKTLEVVKEDKNIVVEIEQFPILCFISAVETKSRSVSL